jgi:TonB family protein
VLLRFGFAGLALAGTLGCGLVRITSEGTHDPRGEPRAERDTKVLDLELAHRLTYFESIQVFRLDETPSESCDLATMAGASGVHCHRILDSVAAPTVGWSRSMTSLVVWGSEFVESNPREFPKASHAVRFVSEFGHADVLFSLRKKRLAVVSEDLSPALGSFDKSYERILLLLVAALPRDPELRELLALEDSVRVDATELESEDQPKALWADCPAPPSQPPLYDEEPVPLTAPTPTYPTPAKDLRIQGKVVLQVYIEQDGTPCWVRVLRGDPLLVDAAVESVRQWRFQPARNQGTPVGCWMEIPMDFKL